MPPKLYGLDFLVCFHEEEYEYRTINCYCSVISDFHEKIEGSTVGKYPEVCTLTGVFNFRPPQLRYLSTWDVQMVLEFIKNNWTDNNSFTLKLTMLLRLASRASKIHYLHICVKSLSVEKVFSILQN